LQKNEKHMSNIVDFKIESDEISFVSKENLTFAVNDSDKHPHGYAH
jgi:hypothetical protein